MRARVAAALAAAALACAAPPWQRATLYDDLGGETGVARLVSAFVDELARDERVVAFFDDTDMARFEAKFAEQLCVLAEGPCTYTGDDMRTVHAALGVRDRHMNAVVEDLQRAMRRTGVAWPVQNRLLARLAPLHRDIVGVPAPAVSRPASNGALSR